MRAAPKSTYFAGLDGLRAVSVMIVFLAHAGLGHIVPGGFGVTVFFFLSGFLITSLLVREHETYGSISISAFYLRRLVRLVPPVLLTIGLAVIAVWFGFAQGGLDPWTIFSQVFFFFNYYTQSDLAEPSVSGLGILWSLSVEEQFYLVFPFVFIALVRSRWNIPVIAAITVLVLVWRVIRFEVFQHSHYEIYISTDTRIDSILFGCLLALVSARYPERLTFIARQKWVMLALALCVIVLSFVVRDPTFRATLRYSVQGLALIPIFYLAVNHPNTWLFSWLNWMPIRRLGQYSYTFYLSHFVIINMLIFNGLYEENMIVLMLIAFVLTILYSFLVYRYVEKPLHPLRSRLIGHN